MMTGWTIGDSVHPFEYYSGLGQLNLGVLM